MVHLLSLRPPWAAGPVPGGTPPSVCRASLSLQHPPHPSHTGRAGLGPASPECVHAVNTGPDMFRLPWLMDGPWLMLYSLLAHSANILWYPSCA